MVHGPKRRRQQAQPAPGFEGDPKLCRTRNLNCLVNRSGEKAWARVSGDAYPPCAALDSPPDCGPAPPVEIPQPNCQADSGLVAPLSTAIKLYANPYVKSTRLFSDSWEVCH